MKSILRILPVALALTAMSFSATAQVQRWTPESEAWTPDQRDVWQTVVTCLEASVDDHVLRKECVHRDFIGFGIGNPVPRGLLDARFDAWMERTTWNWIEATPLHILVEGNLAVVQYVANTETTDAEGKRNEIWEAWTDVLRKDGGTWRWIADHGHELK